MRSRPPLSISKQRLPGNARTCAIRDRNGPFDQNEISIECFDELASQCANERCDTPSMRQPAEYQGSVMVPRREIRQRYLRLAIQHMNVRCPDTICLREPFQGGQP